MKTAFQIYIDDSGNVDPATTNDPNNRYGSLTAVILRSDYLLNTFNPSFQLLVERHFGKNTEGGPHNLHRRVLNSPPDHGPFSVLKDDDKRKAWNEDALRMFNKAEYTVISACIDKVNWYRTFPEWTGDFYQVLVDAILERAFYFLKNRNGIAEVNIETKNPGKDKRINENYKKSISEKGFDFITSDKLKTVFSSSELNIITKADCRPGAQLADLLAGPALQLIRYEKTRRHPLQSEFVKALCRILEASKFYRESVAGKISGPDGYGKLWRPKR